MDEKGTRNKIEKIMTEIKELFKESETVKQIGIQAVINNENETSIECANINIKILNNIQKKTNSIIKEIENFFANKKEEPNHYLALIKIVIKSTIEDVNKEIKNMNELITINK